MEFYSDITNRSYEIEEVVFIENELQAKRYIKHYAKPIDIFTSNNVKEDKVTYVFMKADTKELYQKWKKHELL